MKAKAAKLKNKELLVLDAANKISYHLHKGKLNMPTAKQKFPKATVGSYLDTEKALIFSDQLDSNLDAANVATRLGDKVRAENQDRMSEDNVMRYIKTSSVKASELIDNYNGFVYFNNDLEDEFEGFLASNKYIDCIYSKPFLYKSLYAGKYLSPHSADLFVDLSLTKCSITMYFNGEYMSHTELRFGLQSALDKYAIMSGNAGSSLASNLREIGLDFSFINSRGDNENMSARDLLANLLDASLGADIFSTIAVQCKLKDISSFNSIVICSEIGAIAGLKESFIEAYPDSKVYNFKELNISYMSNEEDFYYDYSKEFLEKNPDYKKELRINPHLLLTMLSLSITDVADEELNFSIFLRPPPFLKRPSGQVIASVIVSILVGSAYPLYLFGDDWANKEGYLDGTSLIEKQDEESNLRGTCELQREKIQRAESEKEAALQERDKSRSNLQFSHNLLNDAASKKLDYQFRTKSIMQIVNVLNEFNVKVKSLEFNGESDKSFLLKMEGGDINITKTIQCFTSSSKVAEHKLCFNKTYNIDNKDIKRNDSGVYEAELQMGEIKEAAQ